MELSELMSDQGDWSADVLDAALRSHGMIFERLREESALDNGLYLVHHGDHWWALVDGTPGDADSDAVGPAPSSWLDTNPLHPPRELKPGRTIQEAIHRLRDAGAEVLSVVPCPDEVVAENTRRAARTAAQLALQEPAGACEVPSHFGYSVTEYGITAKQHGHSHDEEYRALECPLLSWDGDRLTIAVKSRSRQHMKDITEMKKKPIVAVLCRVSSKSQAADTKTSLATQAGGGEGTRVRYRPTWIERSAEEPRVSEAYALPLYRIKDGLLLAVDCSEAWAPWQGGRRHTHTHTHTQPKEPP